MMNENQQEYVVLHELIEAGLAALDPVAKDYLIGGAETESTILRNRSAIDRRALRPRVLTDVDDTTVGTEILGYASQLPLFLAPIGALHRFHGEASAGAAKAANEMKIPMFFGALSPLSPEEMRASTQHCAVYQLYIRENQQWVDDLVQHLEAVGFNALCFTVDSAVYSRRERDIVRRIKKPWRQAANMDSQNYQAAFTWKDIQRIRQNSSLPIILKGIASVEDARLAIEHGVDVVYVSNHGGRQLDHAQGTTDTLAEIATALAGQLPLFVDGGFMRGTDILKAIALGADAVGLGRLYCLALAAGGQQGVTRMLQLIEEELLGALALMGASSLAGLSRSAVIEEPFPPSQPHLFSSFPLMDRGRLG